MANVVEKQKSIKLFLLSERDKKKGHSRMGKSNGHRKVRQQIFHTGRIMF